MSSLNDEAKAANTETDLTSGGRREKKSWPEANPAQGE